jgi:predicted integral membrane protein DUF2269
LASIYSWIVYLHVLSILAFLAGHGVTIGTIFKLRRQNNPEETKILLNLSRGSLQLSGAALMITLVTGITLGFLGNWWNQLWIWAALTTFMVGYALMSAFGTRSYDRARLNLGIKTFYKQRGKSAAQPQSGAVLTQSNFAILTILGAGGLIFILWLMLFKPF